MRKLSVTVLLWFCACTISSEDFRAVESTVNVVEDATSPELTRGEGVGTTTPESSPSIMEGIINDPPLDVSQEIVLQTTPTAEEFSLLTVSTTEANADDVIQATAAADQVSDGGPCSLPSIPFLPLTTPTADGSSPRFNSVEEEVVEEEALVDVKSDHLTTVSELTAPERSETQSSAALTVSTESVTSHQSVSVAFEDVAEEKLQSPETTFPPLTLPHTAADETSVTTAVDAVTYEDMEVSTNAIDDSTAPPVIPITTKVQDALIEATPEREASSAESTTSNGPISLSESTSVTPEITTSTSAPEQINVVTTLLEDNISSTALSDSPAPQVSYTTTPKTSLLETVASFPPTEALPKQPAESTLPPYTPTEGDLSLATPATLIDASELTSSVQSSSISTGEVDVITDGPLIAESTVQFTKTEPIIGSNPSLSVTTASIGEVASITDDAVMAETTVQSTTTEPTFMSSPSLPDAPAGASDSASSVQSSSASPGEVALITDDPLISLVTVRTTAESILSDVATTAQESAHSQSSTDGSSPSFTTTTSEELSLLQDFVTSPILEVTSSAAETSTDGVAEILTGTAETDAGSVVTSTFSPKIDSTLTNDIQQTPTQKSYSPTSVEPPGTGSERSHSLTTESVASDESSFMKIGSSSQFPDLSQSTILTTTFKPTQKTTYIQEEHTTRMAESTAGVSITTMTSKAVTTSPVDILIAKLTTQAEPILLTTLPSPTTSSESYLPNTSSSPFLFSSPISTTVALPSPKTSAPSITELTTPVPISSVTRPLPVTIQTPTAPVSMSPTPVYLPQTDISLPSAFSEEEKTTDMRVSLTSTTVLPASLTSESIIITLPQKPSSEITIQSKDVTSPTTDSSLSLDVVSSTGTPVSLTSPTPSTVVITLEEQKVTSIPPTPSISTYPTLGPMELYTDGETFTNTQTSTTEATTLTSVSQPLATTAEISLVPVVTETMVGEQTPATSRSPTPLHTMHTTLPTTEHEFTPKAGPTTPIEIKPGVSVGLVTEETTSTVGPISLPPIVPKSSDVTSDTPHEATAVPATSRGLGIASAVSMGLIIIFVSILLCVFAISAVGGWLEYRKKQRRRRPQAVNLVRVERGGSDDFTDGWIQGRRQPQQQAWMTCQSAALQPPSAARQEPVGGKLARQCSCKHRRFLHLFPGGRHHTLCMRHGEGKQQPTEELRALRVISLSDEDEVEAISSESMLLSGIGRRRVSGASDVALTAEQQPVRPETRSTGKGSPILEGADDGETDNGNKKWLFIDEV